MPRDAVSRTANVGTVGKNGLILYVRASPSRMKLLDSADKKKFDNYSLTLVLHAVYKEKNIKLEINTNSCANFSFSQDIKYTLRKKKESLVTKLSLLKEPMIESLHFIRRSSLIFW